MKFRKGTGISVSGPNTITKAITINGKQETFTYPNKATGGHIIAKGTPDSLITFTTAPGGSGEININAELRFSSSCGWNDTIMSFVDDVWEYVKIDMGDAGGYLQNVLMKNCIVDGLSNSSYGFGVSALYFIRSHFINSMTYRFGGFLSGGSSCLHSNFVNINYNNHRPRNGQV